MSVEFTVYSNLKIATGSSEPAKPPYAELSRLADAYVQGAGNSGSELVSSYPEDFLRELYELPDSYIVTAEVEKKVVGFCLFHLKAEHFPKWLKLPKHPSFERAGFAHLVIIEQDFRGSKFGIYQRFVDLAKIEIGLKLERMFCLVRTSNSEAKRSHLRLGWVECSERTKVQIAGLDVEFEYLILSLQQ